MSFRVTGASEFQLLVDGKDMQIGKDTLKEVSLIENARESIPSIALTFLDNKNRAGSFGLFQDGTPIHITIGDGKTSAIEYKFQQWSIDSLQALASGELASLHGVANVVPWFTSVTKKHHEGNSHEVIPMLAKMGGIEKVISDITTMDKMVHLPDGRTIAQFARRIMDHAWIGAGSCPHLALTSQGGQWALRMSDIMKPSSALKTLASPGIGKKGDLIIWDYRIQSNSGPNNKFVNYGHKVVQEMLSGAANIHLPMQFAKMASQTGISSALSTAVGVARTLYHPPDGGNTHDNFAKALHNNRMARATFSAIIHVMLDTKSDLKLMDDVQVQLARSNGEPDDAYSGTYKVSAKTVHISRGMYREKIELTGQGSGGSGSGK